MTSYRRYKAVYPFEARDQSEVTIDPGHTLIVSQNAQGAWPSQDKWMHGSNEDTGLEGDFPGNFVEFVEEFIEPDPEPEPVKVLPPLPPIPDKPPTPGSRGGVQVFPVSPPTTISPHPRPPVSPSHRSMGHSMSQGLVGMSTNNEEEAPPPPPRRGGASSQGYSYIQPPPGVTENHYTTEDLGSPPPQGPPPAPKPAPRPRQKRVSEPSRVATAIEQAMQAAEISDQHNWVAVTYQIPVECAACKFVCVIMGLLPYTYNGCDRYCVW